MDKLPIGISKEMIEEARTKHGIIKLATLSSPDTGEDHGVAIVGKPSAQAINQFEKFIDRDPLRAKMALINGTFCTRKDEIKNADPAGTFFAACFDAAAQMLPIGKAQLKNI